MTCFRQLCQCSGVGINVFVDVTSRMENVSDAHDRPDKVNESPRAVERETKHFNGLLTVI